MTECKAGYHELMDLGILEIEPLTYIRGEVFESVHGRR